MLPLKETRRIDLADGQAGHGAPHPVVIIFLDVSSHYLPPFLQGRDDEVTVFRDYVAISRLLRNLLIIL